MATVVNRSPFVVVPRATGNAHHEQKFRSRKAAESAKAALEGIGVPSSIKQAEIGSWEAVVRLKDGAGEVQPLRERFDTKEQAEKWAAEKECVVQASRTKKISMTVNQTPWREAVLTWYAVKACGLTKDDWQDDVAQAEATGILRGKRIIGYILKRVIDDFKPETPIAEITVPVIRKWRDRMVQVEKYTPSTIANFRQIISGTFRYFISERDLLVEYNPCQRIQWPKPDNVVVPPKLSSTELKRPTLKVVSEDTLDDNSRGEIAKSDKDLLLQTIKKRNPWLLNIVRFALETAARRSEILRLEWEHIDLKEGTLWFCEEKNDWRKGVLEEKGRKLAIWKDLNSLLLEIEPNPINRTGKVFKKGTASSCSHSFVRACESLGWFDMNFHSLRKIGTGLLSKELSNVVELSQITGHKDLKVLAERYYGTDFKKLAEKINNARARNEA